MMGARPNILFLTVDALRADRMSLYGYDRPTTPRLDAIAKDALVCDPAFSLAAFTQASFPSFLTSSRPLSYGGYDDGVRGRPPTVFKAFSDAGYNVTLLSSFKWVTRFFGYGEGVDSEAHLFGPNTLVGAAVNRMKSSLSRYHAGVIPQEQALHLVEPVVLELFQQIDEFCGERAAQMSKDRVDFADTALIRDGYDYGAIRRVVSRHSEEFKADPGRYLDRHLHYLPKAHEWIAADWRLSRTKETLVRRGTARMIDRLIGLFNPDLELLRRNRFKSFVDGTALANRVIRTIAEHDDSQPFFIWTHFCDAHIPYMPGSGPKWYRQAGSYLEALGYDPNIDPVAGLRGFPKTDAEWQALSTLYDATVLYVDEQIGRIMDALDDMGLRENTLLVLCADHGEELGEHGNISHYFRLHDHNVRVPLIFHNPSLEEKRITGLTTLIDLAPTMADLAGVPIPDGWEGEPVTSATVAERSHVVMETFYGGNCIFDHRPLYMSVRTGTHQYLWKEYMDPEDRFGPEGNELYDLAADPRQQENLYRPDHPLVAGFNRIIDDRLAEIPEITLERRESVFRAGAGEPLAAAPPGKDIGTVDSFEMMGEEKVVRGTRNRRKGSN